MVTEENWSGEAVLDLDLELSAAVSSADHQADRRDARVRRQRFEGRPAGALDMAEGEPEVVQVFERSFAPVAPDAPAETMLSRWIDAASGRTGP